MYNKCAERTMKGHLNLQNNFFIVVNTLGGVISHKMWQCVVDRFWEGGCRLQFFRPAVNEDRKIGGYLFLCEEGRSSVCCR